MALFEGAYMQPNSRSHTRLVVSDGDSPAERWIHDPSLPSLFEYHYGGPGEVVIPKGYAVALGNPARDWDTGRRVDTITIADPGNGLFPIGICQYNVYKRENDRLKGNQPSIITRQYIELPYIPNADDAALIKWGLVFGSVTSGDYVKATSDPDNLGKLEKWDPDTDKVHEIVGQILAMERDLPPTGWLKWVTPEIDDPHSERAPDTNTSGQTPDYDYVGDSGGYAFDPNYKWPLTPDYRAENIPWMKTYAGIPGLTDGDEIAIRRARVTSGNGMNTINLTVPQGFPSNRIVAVDSVTINGVEGTMHDEMPATPSEGDWVFDPENKQVQVQVDGAGKSVVVQYRTQKVVGVMPGWNFAGSTGAVRILLKF